MPTDVETPTSDELTTVSELLVPASDELIKPWAADTIPKPALTADKVLLVDTREPLTFVITLL